MKDLVLEVVAKKNSRALNDLADDFEKAAKETDDFGKKLANTESFSKHLEDQISKTKVQVTQLGEEFDKTGNKDVFANLKGAQANLKSLEGIQRSLKGALPPAEELDRSLGDVLKDLDQANTKVVKLTEEFRKTKSTSVFGDLKTAEKDLEKIRATVKDITSHLGPQKGPDLSKSLIAEVKAGLKSSLADIGQNLPELAGPFGIALGAALVVGATPVIAAGLASAIGLGLIGGAALIEKDNARITGAVSVLKSDIGRELKGAAAPLVPEFVEALGSVDKFISDESGTLADAFAAVKPAIVPVTAALEGLLRPILAELPKVGATFTEVFSDPKVIGDIGEIGDSIGSVLATVSNNGRVIKVVFADLAFGVKAAADLFDLFLNATNLLSAGFDKLKDSVKLVSAPLGFVVKGLEDFGHSLGIGGDKATAAAAGSKDLSTALGDQAAAEDKVKAATDAANQAITDQINKVLALQGDADTFQQGLNNLSSALDKHTHTIQGNSNAAIQNRQALRDLIGEAEQTRQANIDAGQGVDVANKKFGQQIDQVIALGTKLGIPKDQLLGLLGVYKDYAGQPNINKSITITTYTKKVDLGTQATHHDSYGQARGGVMVAAARGAIYAASNPPLVRYAEPQTGGEAYIPKNIPAARGLALTSETAAWFGGAVVPKGGGGNMRVITEVHFSGNTASAFGSAFLKMQQDGDIQILSRVVK